MLLRGCRGRGVGRIRRTVVLLLLLAGAEACKENVNVPLPAEPLEIVGVEWTKAFLKLVKHACAEVLLLICARGHVGGVVESRFRAGFVNIVDFFSHGFQLLLFFRTIGRS